jgi:hypothetical protein
MGTPARSMAAAVALAAMLAGCYLTSKDRLEGDPCEAFEEDLDNDGWGDCSDCDDSDPQVHPGVPDDGCCAAPDGKDDDCDGQIDEEPNVCDVECPEDLDGDGYVAPEDCDDTNPDVHPGVFDFADACTGLGNGIDDDCNGRIDDGFVGEPDIGCDPDLDGWLAPEDCDDLDPAVNPGAWEDVCCVGDGRDNDCDGVIDESIDSDAPCGPCDVDEDGDGWPSVEDCDDREPFVNPDRDEYCCPCRDEGGGFEYPDCNGTDDDCDGLVDETSLRAQYEDEFCCSGHL